MSLALFLRWHHLRKAEHMQPPPDRELPRSIREASNTLANEAIKLRVGVEKIRKSPDPMKELLKVMLGPDHDGKGRSG